MSMPVPTSDPNKAAAAAKAVAARAEIADARAKLQSLVPSVAGWYQDVNGQPWSFDGTTWTWHQTDTMIDYSGWTDITTYLPFEEIQEPLSLMSPTEALDQANTDLASAQSEVAAAEAMIAAEDSGSGS